MKGTPDWIRESLAHAAVGRNSHADTVKAVTGLTVEAAARRPSENAHNIWENLWHTVAWQRLLLNGIRGQPEDWETMADKNFPPQPAPETQEEWDALVAEFTEGVETTQHLAMEADLSAPIPGWGPIAGRDEMTVGYALTILCTHATYHISQIIHIRIALGLWPPS